VYHVIRKRESWWCRRPGKIELSTVRLVDARSTRTILVKRTKHVPGVLPLLLHHVNLTALRPIVSGVATTCVFVASIHSAGHQYGPLAGSLARTLHARSSWRNGRACADARNCTAAHRPDRSVPMMWRKPACDIALLVRLVYVSSSLLPRPPPRWCWNCRVERPPRALTLLLVSLNSCRKPDLVTRGWGRKGPKTPEVPTPPEPKTPAGTCPETISNGNWASS